MWTRAVGVNGREASAPQYTSASPTQPPPPTPPPLFTVWFDCRWVHIKNSQSVSSRKEVALDTEQTNTDAREAGWLLSLQALSLLLFLYKITLFFRQEDQDLPCFFFFCQKQINKKILLQRLSLTGLPAVQLCLHLILRPHNQLLKLHKNRRGNNYTNETCLDPKLDLKIACSLPATISKIFYAQ